MSLQFDTAWEVHQFLAGESVPYAIIGGIAVQHWGEPRFTRDVDVTILVPLGGEEPVVTRILATFPSRITEPVDFALRNRVCLVKTAAGVDVDISLGIPGYEEEVVRRAVECDLGAGRVVHICSAEDLVIHKAVAGRPQDLVDIEGVVDRQRLKLDVIYIRNWLGQFSLLLENDEILRRFDDSWRSLEEGNDR